MPVQISLTVNGERVERSVEPRTLLVQFIRDHLGLTGTHVGCDTSQCGACVVHVDGNAVKSCTMLAVQAGGRPCPLSGVYNADAHTMTLPAHLAGFDACVAAHFRPDPAS